MPTPEQLLGVQEFPGLTPEKITRLHSIAHKALSGTLDIERLRHIGPDATTDDMQRLKGIGPFYASLITIRAVGFTDVPPADEPMLRDLVTQLYHLPEPCTRERFLEIAEAWRPYRTWASVLIRAASARLGRPGARCRRRAGEDHAESPVNPGQRRRGGRLERSASTPAHPISRSPRNG